MNEKQVVYGFLQKWEKIYRAYENVFCAIDRRAELANELIAATQGRDNDVQQLLLRLLHPD